MITVREESPITVAGYTIVVVSRATVTKFSHHGAYSVVGNKQPIAIICRGDSKEDIFSPDGTQIAATKFAEFITRDTMDYRR